MATVLQRLKIELNNKEYFDDDTYKILIAENDLLYSTTYDKDSMQRKLLITVKDILEAVSNDVDIMMRVSSEFQNQDSAYRWLKDRIEQLELKIEKTPDPEVVVDYFNSPFTLMFTRSNTNSTLTSI